VHGDLAVIALEQVDRAGIDPEDLLRTGQRDAEQLVEITRADEQ